MYFPRLFLDRSNHNSLQPVPEKLWCKVSEWFVQPYAINWQKRHKQNPFVFYYNSAFYYQSCGVFVSRKFLQHLWSVAWMPISICQKLPSIWSCMKTKPMSSLSVTPIIWVCTLKHFLKFFLLLIWRSFLGNFLS